MEPLVNSPCYPHIKWIWLPLVWNPMWTNSPCYPRIKWIWLPLVWNPLWTVLATLILNGSGYLWYGTPCERTVLATLILNDSGYNNCSVCIVLSSCFPCIHGIGYGSTMSCELYWLPTVVPSHVKRLSWWELGSASLGVVSSPHQVQTCSLCSESHLKWSTWPSATASYSSRAVINISYLFYLIIFSLKGL